MTAIYYCCPGCDETNCATCNPRESMIEVVFGLSDAQAWQARHNEAVADYQRLLEFNIWRARRYIRELWSNDRVEERIARR